MRSWLSITVAVLVLLVAGLVIALRGSDSGPAVAGVGGERASSGTPSTLASEPIGARTERSAVVPEPPAPAAPKPTPAPVVAEAARPREIPIRAPTDDAITNDAVPSQEDAEKQAEYFASKYEGWSTSQKLAAIERLKEECRLIETTSGEIKLRSNEYAALMLELNWLKEHQDP